MCLLIFNLLLLLLLLSSFYIYICYKVDQNIDEFFASVPFTGMNTLSDQNNKITFDESLKDCYGLMPKECLKCGQCGIAEREGIYKCMPGDVYGPSYTLEVDNWIYGNSYDRYIYGENIVKQYKPWNKDVKNNIVDLLGLFY